MNKKFSEMYLVFVTYYLNSIKHPFFLSNISILSQKSCVTQCLSEYPVWGGVGWGGMLGVVWVASWKFPLSSTLVGGEMQTGAHHDFNIHVCRQSVDTVYVAAGDIRHLG